MVGIGLASVYDITLHYGNQQFSLRNIDLDRYSYIDLLDDVCEKVMNRVSGGQNLMIALSCDVPCSDKRMDLNIDSDVMEMFSIHKRNGYINVYVREQNANVEVNFHDNDSNINNAGINENSMYLTVNNLGATLNNDVNKHNRKNARKGIRTSKRLGGKKDFMSASNLEDVGINDDIETDDELYLFSDNDEMCAEFDDELFNSFVVEGLEHCSEDSGNLSGYESTNEVEAENDSDTDLENDLMGACLNGVEFSIPEGEKFRLLKGMMFPDVHTFRKVLYEYVIQWGFPLIRDKNEKCRVTAHCGNDGCEWRVHASPMPDGVTFAIKACNPDHTCVMSEKISATAKWMASKIVNLLRTDSSVKPQVLRHELAKYGVNPSDMQLFRAKQKALAIIEGNHAESYKLLPKYCIMVLNTNPGSIAKIEFEMSLGSQIPSVKRVFVGLDAMKKGFLAGCLPFIGFDGCHLKGPYGGVLLSAVGLDGNNGLFPIAFAVVKSENKESWLFFFKLLSDLLDGFPRDKPWTFMTDRQKGLIEAVNSQVPWAVNRKCCRHIYSNFRGQFPGVMLRQLFWQAARSYSEKVFKESMARMKEIKPAAYEWLEKIPYNLWARHAFPTDLKNDHITNNIAESFNHWVADLREKTVLNLLDGLRAKLMSRIQKRFEKACLLKKTVVPNVVKKLNDLSIECRKCTLLYASGIEFQVKEYDVSYIVNIKEKTCECKAWQLTGIPCKHAVAVLINKRDDLEKYCDSSLSKDQYVKAYNEVIHPIPHVSFWPDFDVNPSNVLPPMLRRRSGRPKKARRREQGETPAVGQGKRSSTLRCSKCKQFGHNKRTCEGGPKRDRKGNFKRRKLHSDTNRISEQASIQGSQAMTVAESAPVDEGTQESAVNNMNFQQSIAMNLNTGGAQQSVGMDVNAGGTQELVQASQGSVGSGTNYGVLEEMFGSSRASSLLGKNLAEKVMKKAIGKVSAHSKGSANSKDDSSMV